MLENKPIYDSPLGKAKTHKWGKHFSINFLFSSDLELEISVGTLWFIVTLAAKFPQSMKVSQFFSRFVQLQYNVLNFNKEHCNAIQCTELQHSALQ